MLVGSSNPHPLRVDGEAGEGGVGGVGVDGVEVEEGQKSSGAVPSTSVLISCLTAAPAPARSSPTSR